MRRLTTLLTAALIAVPALLLTACAPATQQNETASPAADIASSVTLSDGWTKSAELGGMTGLFGTLENAGEEDLTIVNVESSAADMIELHEVTADGMMQEIEGDVVIPAKGSFELAPGANHIMLMDLTKDLLAGDEVTLTLTVATADGDTASIEFTVFVKDYAGANESYEGSSHDADASHSADESADAHESHDSHESH